MFAVACGEFHEDSFQQEGFNKCGSAEAADQSSKSEKRVGQLLEPLEQGPTIIYVPTRKETLSIAKFLCGFGVKAAAYNASVCKMQPNTSGFYVIVLFIFAAVC